MCFMVIFQTGWFRDLRKCLRVWGFCFLSTEHSHLQNSILFFPFFSSESRRSLRSSWRRQVLKMLGLPLFGLLFFLSGLFWLQPLLQVLSLLLPLLQIPGSGASVLCLSVVSSWPHLKGAVLVVSVSVSARPYLTWLTPSSQFVAELCSSLLTFFNWRTAEELVYSLVVWLWPSCKVATFTVIASQRGLSVLSSLALHVHRHVHAFTI